MIQAMNLNQNTMKKTFFILFIFCTAASLSFAQESTEGNEPQADSTAIADALGKMFNAKIDIKIDESIFNSKMGNMYLSEKYGAVVIMILAPQSVDKAQENMDKEKKKDGYKSVDHGSYMVDGRKIIFETGTMKKDGEKMMMDMYAVEVKPEASVFMVAAYLLKDKETLHQKIKDSVATIKLVE